MPRASGILSSYPPSLVHYKAAVSHAAAVLAHLQFSQTKKAFLWVPCATSCSAVAVTSGGVALSTKHPQTQTFKVARSVVMEYSTHAPCLLTLFVQAVPHDIVGNVASLLFAATVMPSCRCASTSGSMSLSRCSMA